MMQVQQCAFHIPNMKYIFSKHFTSSSFITPEQILDPQPILGKKFNHSCWHSCQNSALKLVPVSQKLTTKLTFFYFRFQRMCSKYCLSVGYAYTCNFPPYFLPFFYTKTIARANFCTQMHVRFSKKTTNRKGCMCRGASGDSDLSPCSHHTDNRERCPLPQARS